ncbi:uncharacterized protein ASPGLDRAFT_526464 [Aspergillus glaucus CBS 516.65]|uniref:Condensation domain-containing protein n=1 Tax=Aspergillus glaucus CBS 516.65 TaxID=1160497 RepID=A0A1L9VEG6_ASPGL|nr:hypothetical protein ASPGLDRAFT_526464 [Aspergillus glaucus CBS 516.65]OJJ82327.1 hypothetical protein ASPGLDRAFT_526464 [Aspergillus glaucus CBS 516.65]
MFMFLTFDKYTEEGIEALKRGVSHLNAHLPFLTGVVVPSSQSGGKENVCEVQPASASFLQTYPMLQVESHPELDYTAPDDFIDQKYLPLPFFMSPAEPQPLIRFKANVTNTKVILSVAYFHKALDSTAVSVAVRALAELCKDPNTSPELLPTSVSAEESSRQHLLDFAAQSPVPFNWTLTPPTFDPPPEDPGKIPVSQHFKLSAEKISFLKNACNASLSSSEVDLPPLTSNDIITALIGLCGNRARLSTVPDYIPPSPKVIIAANVRKQSLLSATYSGNALSAVEASYDASIFPEGTTLSDGLSASLDSADFTRLANIACNLRKEITALTEAYISGILRTIADTRDMTTFFPAYGRSIIVSSLRWMDFYLDFGALGRVQEYDIPETKVKGVCWVLPAKDLGDIKRTAKQAFELRFVLERAAMKQLKGDKLFQWVSEE